jgi:flagellar biosynthetic protein FliQ
LRILIPAFVTSELKTAFQIGFIIFIPFLIIDMVVASVLMSMGMMMMSPVMVSLPFKLMLFVLVDGWHLGDRLTGTEFRPMTPGVVMEIGRQAIEVTLVLAAPMLLTALIVGLIVSIFQAATQINEATLQFVPKLVAMFIVLILFGPWMLQYIMDYIQRLFGSIPQLIG